MPAPDICCSVPRPTRRRRGYPFRHCAILGRPRTTSMISCRRCRLLRRNSGTRGVHRSVQLRLGCRRRQTKGPLPQQRTVLDCEVPDDRRSFSDPKMEAVCLNPAGQAGWTFHPSPPVRNRTVLLVERSDRDNTGRCPSDISRYAAAGPTNQPWHRDDLPGHCHCCRQHRGAPDTGADEPPPS